MRDGQLLEKQAIDKIRNIPAGEENILSRRAICR
jgi:hypothetical protein